MKRGGNSMTSKKKKVKPEDVQALNIKKSKRQLTIAGASEKCFTDNNGKYSIVYVIQHYSGCFYIGVHTSEIKNPILTTYMTSSTVVKSIIEVDGLKAFTVAKKFYCTSRAQANVLEEILIEMNRPQDNAFILNKSFGSNIVDWSPVSYGGQLLRINPGCMLLQESICPKTTHKFKLPERINGIISHVSKRWVPKKVVFKPAKDVIPTVQRAPNPDSNNKKPSTVDEYIAAAKKKIQSLPPGIKKKLTKTKPIKDKK